MQFQGATTVEEFRNAPRHRVLKSGSILFKGGGIDCVVRNLSSSGAALEVASPIGIPNEFTLIIKDEGGQRQCRVTWRKEKRIGVVFI